MLVIDFVLNQIYLVNLRATGVYFLNLATENFVSSLFVCVLDDICDYFGVKIAMYFAWLGFYTNSMLYPAVVGFLLWILAEDNQVHGA